MRRARRNSFFIFAAFFLPALAFASATDGTIHTTYKYAWSDVGGYLNFAPTNSIIHVTDSGLTGYAWSANDGWINLNPTDGGVTNDSGGTLGGFAWDETNGWISFTGVTIDANGKFHGDAVGANANISFDCNYCDVRTDWRPASERTTDTSSGAVLPGYNNSNPMPGVTEATTTNTAAQTQSPHTEIPPPANTTNPNFPPSMGADSIQTPQGRTPPSGSGVIPTSERPTTTAGYVARAVSLATSRIHAPKAPGFGTVATIGGGIFALFVVVFFALRFFL